MVYIKKFFYLLFLLFFISACDSNKVTVIFNQSEIESQHLKTSQNSSISGGVSEGTLETGIYKCNVITNDTSESNCSLFENFIFVEEEGRFSWTPDYKQMGIFNVVIDSPSGKTNKFVIEVEKTNISPEINVSVVPNVILENSNIEIEFQASDLNQDELSFRYECYGGYCDKLENIKIDTLNNKFIFDTNFESSGQYLVTLFVSDGSSETSTDFTFEVDDVNRKPVFNSIEKLTITENQIWTYALSANDPDADEIIYSCENCPTGFVVNAVAGVINWQPSFSQAGDYEINIIVSDGELSTSQKMSVSVNNLNRAPILSNISNQTVQELKALTTLDAGGEVDLDGDVVSYKCHYDMTIDNSVEGENQCSSLNGLTFNETTGVLNWTPMIGSTGEYEFKIIGTDGQLAQNQIFQISVEASSPIIFVYKTTIANESITLFAGGHPHLFDYYVDWGDGNEFAHYTDSAFQKHTYPSPGEHTVKVYGKVPKISVSTLSQTERDKLIRVESLGRTGLVDISIAFFNCANLVSFKNGDGDTSKVTTTATMFYGAINLTHIDLTNFDTSQVSRMRGMFRDVKKVQNLDVSQFDTSNVIEMDQMFYGASSLKSLDLSNFNTKKVTRMDNMFNRASGLEGLDLSNFDTSSVTQMNGMFSGATKLAYLDISKFNTSNVTDMNGMFYNTGLGQLDLSHFNVTKVKKMDTMFSMSNKLIEIDLSGWILSNPLPTLTNIFSAPAEGRVVYCNQDTIGAAFSITCTP